MEDCHYCEISTHIPQEFTFTKVGKWIYDDWHPSESLWFNIWWRWWWGLLKDTVSSWRTILRHLLYGSIGTFLGVGFRCLLSKSLECGQLWWCAWSKRIFSSGPCFPPSNDDEFIISPPDNHPKQDIARHCLYWGMHLYLGPWRDVRPASNEWNPSFFLCIGQGGYMFLVSSSIALVHQ